MSMVGGLALEGNLELVVKGAEGKLHREAAVTADFHRSGRGQLLAGCQQPFAGGELFLIVPSFDGHTAEAVLHLGI